MVWIYGYKQEVNIIFSANFISLLCLLSSVSSSCYIAQYTIYTIHYCTVYIVCDSVWDERQGTVWSLYCLLHGTSSICSMLVQLYILICSHLLFLLVGLIETSPFLQHTLLPLVLTARSDRTFCCKVHLYGDWGILSAYKQILANLIA